MKENPNKIWMVVSPIPRKNAEWSQYNSLEEALSDFDSWSLDTDSIAKCDVMYRGITMMHSAKGKVTGGACEQYNPTCPVRSKLPNSQEIVNCEACVQKMMKDYA